MTKNYTQQEVEDRVKKLPPVLREALFDADIAEKIYEIGRNAGLTVDKIGLLAQETGDITLGFSKPTDFIKNLSESLGIDQDKARDIAGKINQAVFLPLREALKSAHQFDLSDETIQRGESAMRKPSAAPAATTPPLAIPPLAKKPEMRIGREPTDDELGIKNYELRTATPAVPPPPKPPIAPINQKPPSPIGGKLKDEIEKVLKPPTAPSPIGTSPSWIKDKNSELRTENLAAKPIVSPTPELNSKISDLSSGTLTSPPIDLRAQYRPTTPPSSPKVPPINLRKNLELRTENLVTKNNEEQKILQSPLLQQADAIPKLQTSPTPPPPEQPKPPEKKMPPPGIDPYKEPIN